MTKRISTPFDPLGKTRNKLLERLGNSGHLLVTPIMEDKFSQMSIPDCRDYVRRVEDYLRDWIGRLS
jgi:hypothetical protein